jgi:hypothetical protein
MLEKTKNIEDDEKIQNGKKKNDYLKRCIIFIFLPYPSSWKRRV